MKSIVMELVLCRISGAGGGGVGGLISRKSLDLLFPKLVKDFEQS